MHWQSAYKCGCHPTAETTFGCPTMAEMSFSCLGIWTIITTWKEGPSRIITQFRWILRGNKDFDVFMWVEQLQLPVIRSISLQTWVSNRGKKTDKISLHFPIPTPSEHNPRQFSRSISGCADSGFRHWGEKMLISNPMTFRLIAVPHRYISVPLSL